MFLQVPQRTRNFTFLRGLCIHGGLPRAYLSTNDCCDGAPDGHAVQVCSYLVFGCVPVRVRE